MRKTTLMTAAALCLTWGIAQAQPPAEQPGGGGIGFQSVRDAREKGGKKAEPPTLNLKSEEGSTWPMLATILIIVACGVVAIIPPKRGHQD